MEQDRAGLEILCDVAESRCKVVRLPTCDCLFIRQLDNGGVQIAFPCDLAPLEIFIMLEEFIVGVRLFGPNRL